jgi:prepilin-type N-terminal cleavage/methylation domain-containing protein
MIKSAFQPQKTKTKKGFTIIEVVLVLAIAGLIFLMVFVALPALQRLQRNTQRKDDIARILAAVQSFQSNNSGRIPFDTTDKDITTRFVTRYIDSSCANAAALDNKPFWDPYYPAGDCTGNHFRDPDGTLYSFRTYRHGAAGYSTVQNSTAAIDDGLFDYRGRHKDDNGYQYENDMQHIIFVFPQSTCGTSEGALLATGNSRDVSLMMILEGGALTCVSNGGTPKDASAPAVTFYLQRAFGG